MMVIVGLDCAKRAVTCNVLRETPTDVRRYCQNADYIRLTDSLEDLLKLSSMGDLFLIEPTSTYYRTFADSLTSANKQVRLVNSKSVKHYAESYGLLTKSDRVDPAAIACFGWERLNQPGSLFSITNYDLRDLCSEMRMIGKNMARIRQQITLALIRECPEWESTHKDSNRDYLDPDPPALWRYLAGEKTHNANTRDRQLKSTVGCGLTETTRQLAITLCAFDRYEYHLEKRLEGFLILPEHSPQMAAYDDYWIPRKLRGHLLTIHAPFDRFLQDGRERVEYLKGPKSTRSGRHTKRNRSLQGWMLMNGLGKVQIQSGDALAWVPGGSSYLRGVWWQSVKSSVVLRRTKATIEVLETAHTSTALNPPYLDPGVVGKVSSALNCPPPLASLWIRYHDLKKRVRKDNARLMAVSRACATGVYRSLLKSHKQSPGDS